MKNSDEGISKWARALVIVAFSLGAVSCGGGDGDGNGDGNGDSPAAPESGGGGQTPNPFTRAQSIKELQRVRQCVLALITYSSENDGRFPPAGELAAVITKFGDASLLHIGGAEEGDPLLYTEGITDSSPVHLPILASPAIMAGKRAVGFSDGAVLPLSEEEFAAEKAKLKAEGLELK